MDYKEQYQYVIFKYNVYDADFLVLPADECPNSGFSSLYRITAETAETLRESGIAGYRGAVWSPQLIVDIDDEEASMEARSRLAQLGLSYEVWTTGNRGVHLYIDRPHSPSHLLPQIDKEWVKSNISNADLGIYSSLHMFRLPGTVHSKTGKSKVLVKRYEGRPLLLADSVTQKEVKHGLLGRPASKSVFTDDKVMNWTVPWEEGQRHLSLLNLGIYMKKIGEPMGFIARWLYHANLLNSPPKPQEELERIIDFVAGAGDESI